ncbi:putative sugar O-methyltransferase [Amycolatopsis vastitatis]|uniref:Methyltransferase n=1 Tax=Amycolatopsis vastitatis TaxID=1905142 RepID=A0A229SLS6_9PSEU|nr:putative sugar O-methyltransferase [Amycolatopsis vastitatis]OXM59611.1 methyltransferase [Amycolatopsis vastitatis]
MDPVTKRKYEQSPQWAQINDSVFADESATDMARFKSDGINYKFTMWDPRINGVRYLKTLIYNLACTLSPENLARLRRIANREVGAPVTVTYGGDAICMDYLLAVQELEFVSGHVELDGGRVLEIGAGYGRTCHAFLANHDLAEYWIIDLPKSLEMSEKYLREVLDEHQFAKVRFVAVDDIDDVTWPGWFDLCVNINSFAEMTAETVRNYLALIDGRCRAFYTKNPVGKYLDVTLDGHVQGADTVALALSTGPLTDVIDIHDSDAVAGERAKFLEAYRPAAGWVCAEDGWAKPWSFYWQALYLAPGA